MPEINLLFVVTHSYPEISRALLLTTHTKFLQLMFQIFALLSPWVSKVVFDYRPEVDDVCNTLHLSTYEENPTNRERSPLSLQGTSSPPCYIKRKLPMHNQWLEQPLKVLIVTNGSQQSEMRSSGLWYLVTWKVVTNFSEEPVASIFRRLLFWRLGQRVTSKCW
jgi:hypothetical protein